MDGYRFRRAPSTIPPVGGDPAQRAEALAIEALDELVGKLIRRNDHRVPAEFLDWVGAEATQLAIRIVKRYMDNDAFVTRINSDRAEVTVLRVVYRAIMPQVHARFKELTENLTNYSPLIDLPSSSD